uniref:Uncharacterized protein n=1 Tax=Leersia perrieri TaxID=77586 RepID=A0A0D9V753_9ORYZ
MGALYLPAVVVEAIDKRRRTFLWTVYSPKGKGGLGVKSIQLQNEALLQKFLIKLHKQCDAPWVKLVQATIWLVILSRSWVHTHHSVDNLA